MISFMLEQSMLLAVLASAVVGFIVCMILHSFCPCKQCCDKSMECNDMPKKGCCGPNNCGPHNKEHCCGAVSMVLCKLSKFAVLFVQAYGLAFVMQQLGVLSLYADSIAVALFLGLTFIVSHMFIAVAKHKRSALWFISKSVHVLLVLAIMAAVIVYMASK